MNILILSAGTRNKVVQYFKKTFVGEDKVIATDMTDIAPAVYEADKFYKVPRMTEPGYIDIIFDVCKKEKINAVLTLIDPELSLLAANKDKFAELGVTVIGSSYELCERALDKMQMYNWLKEHGYNCAKSYDDKDAFYRDLEVGVISFPVFVKPIRGSASCNDRTGDQHSVGQVNTSMFQHHLEDGVPVGTVFSENQICDHM